MTPRKAASSKGAAARSEVGKGKKKVSFRGLNLKIPAKAPGEVMFDIGANDVMGTLRTILGNDQLKMLREKVCEDGLSLDQTSDELVEFLTTDIFADKYGIKSGE